MSILKTIEVYLSSWEEIWYTRILGESQLIICTAWMRETFDFLRYTHQLWLEFSTTPGKDKMKIVQVLRPSRVLCDGQITRMFYEAEKWFWEYMPETVFMRMLYEK